MQWIILEALVALALGLLIVSLALSPARKGEGQEERRNADPEGRNDASRD